MRTNPPPTLDTVDCEKILDVLLHGSSTPKKKAQSIRNHCMALLMLDAGLRVGELVSLRMSSLYFNSVPVRNIIIKPHMTKSKVEHSIPVSDRLTESLRSFFSSSFLCDLVNDGDFAFTSVSTDRPITTRQVERIICAAGFKSFGRPVHPHVLRHTYASRLMRVTNSSTVQELLGHKNLSSTQVYCHPNEEDKREAIQAVANPGTSDQRSHQETENPAKPSKPPGPGPGPASGFPPAQPAHW